LQICTPRLFQYTVQGRQPQRFTTEIRRALILGQVLAGLAIRAWRAQHGLRVTAAVGGDRRSRRPRAFDFRTDDRWRHRALSYMRGVEAVR